MSNKMRQSTATVLRIVGGAWIAVVTLLLLASLAVSVYQQGIGVLTEFFSPFNVGNYIFPVLALAPGILCQWGANKLSPKVYPI